MAKFFRTVSASTPDVYNYPGPYDPWGPPGHKHPPGGKSGRVTDFGSLPHAVVVEGSVSVIPLPPATYPTTPPFQGPFVGIGITYRDVYADNPFTTMRACVGIEAKGWGGWPDWGGAMWGVSNVAWSWYSAQVVGNSGTFRLYANVLGIPITINTSTGPFVLNAGNIAGLWGNVLIGSGAIGFIATGQGITGVEATCGDILGDNQFDAPSLAISGAGVYTTAAPVLTNVSPPDSTTVLSTTTPLEFDLVHEDVFSGTLIDGIDNTKTKVWVNGALIYENLICAAGWSVVVSGTDDLHFVFSHPAAPFTAGSDIAVSVYAEDADGLNSSGGWSFHVNASPAISNQSPTDLSVDQPSSSAIAFDVTDFDGTVLAASVTCTIEGVLIYAAEAAIAGWLVTRSAIAGGYHYVVTGPGYPPGDTINVSVYAEDDLGASTTSAWSFTILAWAPTPWPPGPWSPPPAPLPVGPWPSGPFPGPGCSPLENPSFEEAGVQLGEANAWTQGYHNTGQDIAEFSYDPTFGYTLPYEGFEGHWGLSPFNNAALSGFPADDSGLTAALFESGHHDHENFETSWHQPKTSGLWNHQSAYSFDIGNFTRASFDTATDTEEDFEHNWGSSPYCQASKYSFDVANFIRASFDTATDTEEDFENNWGSSPYNQASKFVFDVANFTRATFDTGVDTEEDFEAPGWTTVLPP